VFNNTAIFCDGLRVPKIYDGTSVRDGVYSPAPIANKFFACHVFKNRVYYLAREDLGFYYTELFASEGTITHFPLTGIAGRGGVAVAVNSWTVDGGDGVDDYLAIFTSEGEVLVYQGTDPGSDFQIVGRYFIGKVIGQQAMCQVFGKLFVVTERDYIYLPDALATGGNQGRSKLSGAAKDALSSYSSLVGWKAHYSTSEGLLIVNVPTGNSTAEQHVINVRNGAATRFTGLNARSFADFQGSLYWGSTDGYVYKYNGYKDNGSPITCTSFQAATNLRSNSEKMVSAYKARLRSESDIGLLSGIAYDYGDTSFTQSVTLAAQQGSDGVLPLDWPFDWNVVPSIAAKSEWQRGAGRGTYAQLYLQAQITRETEWYGNEFIVEPGGILR
jgi:hypothetical protein